jgi:hypothetical protein
VLSADIHTTVPEFYRAEHGIKTDKPSDRAYISAERTALEDNRHGHGNGKKPEKKKSGKGRPVHNAAVAIPPGEAEKDET